MRIRILLFVLFICFMVKPEFGKAQYTICNTADSLALVDVYTSTNGPGWDISWNFKDYVANWAGVIVDENGRVSLLDLGYSGLNGKIPSSISNLSALTTLSLEGNPLLTGTIPSTLGSLFNLTSLSLFSDNLTGSIPSALGNLANLTILQLNNNNLSGSIPASLGNLTNLLLLQLQNNQLSGAIPSTFGNLSNLTNLDVEFNQLTGPVPASICALPAIGSILFDNNKFNFSGIECIVQKHPYTTIFYPQAKLKIVQKGHTLSVSAGGTPSNNTYTWYDNIYSDYLYLPDSVKTGDSTFKLKATSPTKYFCTVSNSSVPGYYLFTDSITINPLASISISATPGTIVCAGTSVKFTATVTNGGASPQYQWKKNGTNTGTNSSTYIDSTLKNGDYVSCVLTDGGDTTNSNKLAFTVNAKVNAGVSISDNGVSSICAGTGVNFTASPINGGTSPAYQWKKNGLNVGTNSALYSDNALHNLDNVKVVMTSNATCVTDSVTTSNGISITVVGIVTPSVTTAASPTGSVCAGTKVTFTATPTNGGASPAYQWKKNGSNVGTNSNTYTDSLLKNGDSLWVVITGDAVCSVGSTATSSKIKMVVNAKVTPLVSIAASPSASICAGTKVTFTATPTNGGAAPAYQWKKDGGNVGANSKTYTDSLLKNGDSLWVVMTGNSACSVGNTATSSKTKIVVNAKVTPTVTIAASTGAGICSGTKVIFTATPTNGGTTPAYQWNKNGEIVGTNSNTYTDSLLKNGDVVKAVLTSNVACTVPATSNALKFTVTASVVPAVTISDNITGSNICAGAKIKFTAVALNGGASPAYQWRKNGVIAGTNSAIYTDSLLKSGDLVKVILTSNAACAVTKTATSNSLGFSVQAGVPAVPSAISGPSTVKAGQTGIVFKVTNVAGVKYLWTIPVGDTITNAAGLDSIVVSWHSAAGIVSVKASNACGSSAAVTKSIAVTFLGVNGDSVADEKVTPGEGLGALLYPNPTTSQASLKISGGRVKVIIYVTDLSGKVLWRHETINNTTVTLPFGNLVNGIYIVTLTDGKETKSLKLVKSQ